MVKKSILTLILLILFSSFSLQFAARVDAAIANKEHRRTFTVAEEFLIVEESKKTTVIHGGFQVPAGSPEGFTIFNPVEGDPKAEEKLQETLDSIVVKDDRGNRLDFEIEQNDTNNYIVKVPHPRNIGYNQSSEIFLTYNSYGLIIKTGAVSDLYIPGFPSDYSFQTNDVNEDIFTSLKIPNNLQEINFTSPELPVRDIDGYRVIDIPKESLVGNSAWIQLGKSQFFKFEIKQIVPKTNNFPFVINTFSMPLPRDIESGPITQKVYYSKITPEPYSIELDQDGNLIANFKASAANELEIEIHGYGMLSQSSDFDITNAGSLADISSDFDRYLESAEYWEVNDPSIREAAFSITDSEDIYTIVQETYNFVVNRIDYSFVKKYGLNERKGALATLNGGAAVCMEYSDLFITLLRARGIPARAAFGFGYGAADYESRSENRINHQWAEVYYPAQDTWINVDTTWGYFGNNLIGGDLNHFYSHVASVDPETPSTSELSYFGSLEAIPERDMEIYILGSAFNTDDLTTQSELINSYNSPSGFNQTMYNLNLQAEILNNNIDLFFQNTLKINTTAISLFAKIILTLIIPVSFFAGIMLLRRKMKRATSH